MTSLRPHWYNTKNSISGREKYKLHSETCRDLTKCIRELTKLYIWIVTGESSFIGMKLISHREKRCVASWKTIGTHAVSSRDKKAVTHYMLVQLKYTQAIFRCITVNLWFVGIKKKKTNTKFCSCLN